MGLANSRIRESWRLHLCSWKGQRRSGRLRETPGCCAALSEPWLGFPPWALEDFLVQNLQFHFLRPHRYNSFFLSFLPLVLPSFFPSFFPSFSFFLVVFWESRGKKTVAGSFCPLAPFQVACPPQPHTLVTSLQASRPPTFPSPFPRLRVEKTIPLTARSEPPSGWPARGAGRLEAEMNPAA